jgi:uncharacterized protein YndB with AHSA1/START domain
MEHHNIELEHQYAHPIQEVWEAISNEEAISKWFIQADFQPKVGYDYTFTHESTTITGTVLEVDPPSLLVYSWRVAGVETKVTWQLTNQEKGTLLKLSHVGIEKYGETAVKMFGSFSSGWGSCVTNLESFLAKQYA